MNLEEVAFWLLLYMIFSYKYDMLIGHGFVSIIFHGKDLVIMDWKKLACAAVAGVITSVAVQVVPVSVADAAPLSSANAVVDVANEATIDTTAAKQIAFRHAGYTAEQVTVTRLKETHGHGYKDIDVIFTVEGKEYEYKVSSHGGSIVSYSCEVKDRSLLAGSGQVSVEAAKDIALRHAGISADKAKFGKITTQNEDGIEYYELKFLTMNQLYLYQVCTNGAIKEYRTRLW